MVYERSKDKSDLALFFDYRSWCNYSTYLLCNVFIVSL